MLIVPFDFSDKSNKTQILQVMKRLIDGTLRPAVPYFDLQIDKQAFKEMEITFSPQITYGNELIVNSLVEKYNPTATVNKSCLYGLI